MEKELVVKALDKVISRRKPPAGLIAHSDAGSQYKSRAFKGLMEHYSFRQSMTRKDETLDNSFAESLFSRYKAELLNGEKFHGYEEARKKTFEYIAIVREALSNTYSKNM